MKKLLFVLALLCGAAQADVGDKHIVVHGFSHHTVERPKPPAWNETNPGLGIRYELYDDVSFQAGFYKNSFYKRSYYGVVDYTPLSIGKLSAGGFLGIASGYTDKTGIAGGAIVRWQEKRYSTAIRVIPGGKYNIVAIEIGVKF